MSVRSCIQCFASYADDGGFCSDGCKREYDEQMAPAPPSGPWSFTIPRSLPSRNDEERRHFWRKKKSRDAWAADLRVFKTHLGIPDATGKRAVTITRLMGKSQRPWEPDNVDTKTMVDAMKPASTLTRGRARIAVSGAGLIRDDSERWMTLTVKQERAADGVSGTRVEIEELEGT